MASLSLPCFTTLKSKHGSINKSNFQDLLLHNKINRVLFSGINILSNSITEIKDRAFLSTFKVLEIEECSCDADYLNEMFLLLPNLEHVRLIGGTIKRFTNTFTLKFLKILEIDLQRFNDLAGAFDNLQIEKLILLDNKSLNLPRFTGHLV